MGNYAEPENSDSRDIMRLDRFEFTAMNIAPRRWVQKYIEFAIFKNFLKQNGIDLSGKAILDGGCGSGYSTKLIVDKFHPSYLLALDYMPEQIRLAKKRHLNVDLKVGDLTSIDAAGVTFDAVFVFGVLHHIPEWRKALQQISAVLKPGGVLLVEEPRQRFIYSWEDFESGINNAKLKICGDRNWIIMDFHSYICKKE